MPVRAVKPPPPPPMPPGLTIEFGCEGGGVILHLPPGREELSGELGVLLDDLPWESTEILLGDSPKEKTHPVGTSLPGAFSAGPKFCYLLTWNARGLSVYPSWSDMRFSTPGVGKATTEKFNAILLAVHRLCLGTPVPFAADYETAFNEQKQQSGLTVEVRSRYLSPSLPNSFGVILHLAASRQELAGELAPLLDDLPWEMMHVQLGDSLEEMMLENDVQESQQMLDVQEVEFKLSWEGRTLLAVATSERSGVGQLWGVSYRKGPGGFGLTATGVGHATTEKFNAFLLAADELILGAPVISAAYYDKALETKKQACAQQAEFDEIQRQEYEAAGITVIFKPDDITANQTLEVKKVPGATELFDILKPLLLGLAEKDVFKYERKIKQPRTILLGKTKQEDPTLMEAQRQAEVGGRHDFESHRGWFVQYMGTYLQVYDANSFGYAGDGAGVSEKWYNFLRAAGIDDDEESLNERCKQQAREKEEMRIQSLEVAGITVHYAYVSNRPDMHGLPGDEFEIVNAPGGSELFDILKPLLLGLDTQDLFKSEDWNYLLHGSPRPILVGKSKQEDSTLMEVDTEDYLKLNEFHAKLGGCWKIVYMQKSLQVWGDANSIGFAGDGAAISDKWLSFLRSAGFDVCRQEESLREIWEQHKKKERKQEEMRMQEIEAAGIAVTIGYSSEADVNAPGGSELFERLEPLLLDISDVFGTKSSYPKFVKNHDPILVGKSKEEDPTLEELPSSQILGQISEVVCVRCRNNILIFLNANSVGCAGTGAGLSEKLNTFLRAAGLKDCTNFA